MSEALRDTGAARLSRICCRGQVYDAVTQTLKNTGQDAVRCQLAACDPRLPYKVEGSTVRFLTLEAEQGGQDLSGEGSATDLLVRHGGRLRHAGA